MITSAPDLAASAEKTGFLTKQGKVRKSWKKRWFILKDSNLHYFATPTAAKPINTIKLSSACSTGSAPDPKFPTLQLNTPERVWLFRANDEAEKEAWTGAINDALGKSGAPAATPASSGTADAGSASPAPAGDAAPAAAAAGGAAGEGQLIPVGGKTEHGSEILFHGRILYDFEPRHEDELALKFGDLVAVYLTRDDGWWRAVTADARDGLFPSNYAERI